MIRDNVSLPNFRSYRHIPLSQDADSELVTISNNINLSAAVRIRIDYLLAVYLVSFQLAFLKANRRRWLKFSLAEV